MSIDDYEDDDGWMEFEDDEEDWIEDSEEAMNEMAQHLSKEEEEDRIKGEKETEEELRKRPILYFDPEDLVMPSILGGNK